MQFTAACRGPFLLPWTIRIIGQTEVVLISKDQKDRTLRVRLCVLLIETREFKAGRVRRIARERTNLPDMYENTTYSVIVNE